MSHHCIGRQAGDTGITLETTFLSSVVSTEAEPGDTAS